MKSDFGNRANEETNRVKTFPKWKKGKAGVSKDETRFTNSEYLRNGKLEANSDPKSGQRKPVDSNKEKSITEDDNGVSLKMTGRGFTIRSDG